MSVITRILPKRGLSRWVGHVMHFRGPKWWALASVQAFAWFYKINLDEAEKPFTEYPSIGEFFIRRLKGGVRPLSSAWAVHPADSKITQSAAILNNSMIQAKGIHYSLRDFTLDPDCDKKWSEGYFLTYYLCPTDYHRVHSPVEGKITSVRHIPGQLWPVNEWSTTNIKDLFTVNERILVEIETELGPVGVVFVGATNVGHICLSFDESIRGNEKGPQVMKQKIYPQPIAIKKGTELGYFRMGSTVVMLYPPKFRTKYIEQLKLHSKLNNALGGSDGDRVHVLDGLA